MSEELTGFDHYYASLDDDLLPYHTMKETWKAAQQAAVPSVPVRDKSVTLSGEQLRMAYDFLCPDKDADQEEQELVIQWWDEAHSGAGYYAYYAEYPDEGAMKLELVDQEKVDV